MKFLLFFLLFPLTELYLFIEVGDQIGGLSTVLLTLLTALIGISTARSQGMATAHKLQELLRTRTGVGVQAGQVSIEILSAVMIFAAGVLLFIPGFFTDTLGFLLLIPQLRQHLAAKMIARQASKTGQFQQHGSGFAAFDGHHADNVSDDAPDGSSNVDGNDIIDGEYTRLDQPRILDQSSSSTKGSSTKGSSTKGSSTKGSSTKGSSTKDPSDDQSR